MPENGNELQVEKRDSAVYLLRTAQQHHVQLSAMADQKASILIGAALVIFTLTLGQFRDGGLSLPLIVLSATAVIAGLFAILAVMPRTSVGRPTAVQQNPLFFGNFAKLDTDEFMESIRKVMDSEQSIYYAMANDFYQIGLVLYRRKYRYLAYSYRSFVVGLLFTVLCQLVEVFAPELFAGLLPIWSTDAH